MRLIPFLTAILVVVVLYGLIIKRDQITAFASNDSAEAEATQTGEPAATAPVDAAQTSDAIGVLVRQSVSQPIDNAVVLRGQTQANRQVEVRAQTASKVRSEPLRKGAYVQEGDLLCELSPGTREAMLFEAQARLEEAKSSAPEAQARLEEAEARLRESIINDTAAAKLSKEGYASETRVAATAAAVQAAEAAIAGAKSGLNSAQARIRSAEAAIESAQTELNRLQIKAPFEGLLESDTAELGSLLQPGSLCATVIQLDPIKLVGFVPETEVDRIELGARAGARLATGREVEGRVSFLSRSADPSTRTFSVEIIVDNKDLSIRDGQTAEILIAAPGATAHKLPQSSLTLNNEGQLGVRAVGDDNIVAFFPVQLLRDGTDGVWVGGLPDQLDVIIVGQEFVTAGVQVAPRYEHEITAPTAPETATGDDL